MIRVFVGYDKNEIAAYHVLCQSILARSSVPISITPLNRDNLKSLYCRERGPLESTDFSMSRFLVPYLCGYQGKAIFMDCDMLCLGDIAELAKYDKHAVSVVKHDYVPKQDTKFLGAVQTKYVKKNWSSVMVFNNDLCRALTLDAVNNESGLWLHQFKWLEEHQIGEIPKQWNWLIDEYEGLPVDVKLLHYTLGGPYFDDYRDCTGAQLWVDEFASLNYLRK
jgi:hypothetical protein